jgi:hypothetical protein
VLPVPVELVDELLVPVNAVAHSATVWPDTDSFGQRGSTRSPTINECCSL